ncbi:MAG: c-type cytochrome [Gemmatimonadetes bacterium]|nr:c-type cytochrome [Gemmatimonadota bacterium]
MPRRPGRVGAWAWLAAWWAAATLAGGCGTGDRRAAAGPPDTARSPDVAVPFAPAVLESIPPVRSAPLLPDQRRGQALYNDLCWTCHGLYGHGDGPAARAFPGPLPDLGRLAQRRSVDQMVAGMQDPRAGGGDEAGAPIWHALSPEEVRAALAYVTVFSPPGSRGNPAAGRLLYATHCVHCHGARGAGDGKLAGALRPRPGDLAALSLEGHEARVFADIKAGGSRQHGMYMPRWGRVFSDQELWDLVAYLRVLEASRR